MKRILLGAAVALIGAIALAQDSQDLGKTADKKLTAPKISAKTMDKEEYEIEMAMAGRMVNQQDGWFHDGDFPAIIQALRYEADVWPFDEDTNSSLGWMLGNVNRKDEEIATYMRYARDNANSVDGPFSAAFFYYMKKDYIMTVHLLAPVLKLNGRPDPDVYRLLAHGYQRLGFLNDSLKVWDEYLAHAPKDLSGFMNRNRVAVRLGKPEVHPKD